MLACSHSAGAFLPTVLSGAPVMGARSSFDMTVQKVRQCVGLCRQPRGR